MPKKIQLTQQLSNDIIYYANNNESMLQAAKECGLAYTTFRRYAKKLGVYKPSDHIKALDENRHKRKDPKKIPIEEIIYENKHPHYGTNALKIRLIKNNYIKEKCIKCNITEWNGERLVFHLDHIDGNSKNHHITNLRLLCPNCHSQTETYCSGQRKNAGNRISDTVLLKNIPKYTTVKQVLENSGLSPSKANYYRVDKLIEQHDVKLKEKSKNKNLPLCKVCNNKVKAKNRTYCSYECCHSDCRKVQHRPSKEQLLKELKHNSYLELGRRYGVSDNAIRKWLK
ncbi:hypothetical protein PBI_SCTP2_493 [Salicola phage SCTP-2]|nr:hypothetical protein PBI_SCTP2_493 [Salicola phage SCTP-2]